MNTLGFDRFMRRVQEHLNELLDAETMPEGVYLAEVNVDMDNPRRCAEKMAFGVVSAMGYEDSLHQPDRPEDVLRRDQESGRQHVAVENAEDGSLAAISEPLRPEGVLDWMNRQEAMGTARDQMGVMEEEEVLDGLLV